MAVSAMVTAARAAIETLTASRTSAVEARTAFAGAAMFEGAGFGGTIAARIRIAVATAIVVTSVVVAWAARIVPAAVAARATVSAAASAAEGALEPGTRIAAAYASGIARKIFTRRAGGARCAGFAGKQDGFLFDDHANFGDGKITGFSGGFRLLSRFVLGVRMRFFMSGVRIGFQLLGGAEVFGRLLLNLKLFFIVFFGIFLVLVLGFLPGGIFFVVFLFFVIEFGAASDCVSGGMLLNFLMLGFDELGSERGDLVLIEVHFAADGRFGFLRFGRRGKNQRSDIFGALVADIGASGSCAARERFLFGRWTYVGNAFFGEQPAGKSAREAARTTCTTGGRSNRRIRRCRGGHVHGAIRQKVFDVGWLIVREVLDGSSSGRSLRLAAIFG